MKTKITLFLAALVCSVNLVAQTFTYEGLTYKVNSGTTTLTLTGDGSVSGEVVIPTTVSYNEVDYTVTAIGESAFWYNSRITSITIPESVVSIDEDAFYGSDINSVTILGEGLKSIGESAFDYCSELTSINIPNSVTSIGASAFYSCDLITSIAIPDGVTAIEDRVFAGCDALATVTLGKNIKTIGTSAFNYTAITSIELPEGLTKIGDNAFRNSDITSISFPSTITYIGSGAFYGTAITSVVIPKSVTSIGEGAFAAYLQNITLEEGNLNYHLAGDCLIETASKKLLAGVSTSVIPTDGTVTAIGDDAFYHCTFTSFNIPDGITTIGVGAFRFCQRLTSIDIPSSVISIGDEAFDRCDRLSSVQLSDGLISIGDEAFYGLTNITSLNLTSVETIGEKAFYNCWSLATVTWGDKLKTIGEDAFANCRKLPSITLPKTVTSIGVGAFSRCAAGLTSIVVAEDNPYYRGAGNCLIAIESGRLLVGCKNSVIPDDITITSIASEAFFGCDIVTVTIPDGVTTIWDYAFGECSKLTTVTIGESVKTIGNQAFFCRERLLGGGSLSTTPNTSLTTLIIKAPTPPTIYKQTFNSGSGNLEPDIPVPDPMLPDIPTPGPLGKPTQRMATEETIVLNSITVPCGTLAAYQAATNWSTFATSMQEGFVYDVTAVSDDETRGTVAITQKPNSCANAVAKITATPKDGYILLWSDGSTETSRTITVNKDVHLTAYFATAEELVVTVTEDSNIGELTWGGHENAPLLLCDIIVPAGVTLTCDASEIIANLTVEEGGMLHVTNGATLTVTSTLTAQSQGDAQPQILTESGSNISYGSFQFKKSILADRYYFFSLPFAANTSAVTIDYPGGVQTDTYNIEWNYLYYDGGGYATKEGDGTFWLTASAGSTIEPTKGYSVGVAAPDASTYRELTFTPNNPLEKLDFGLNTTTISVVANDGGTDAKYKGWNFIKNPYTSNYSSSIGSITIPGATAALDLPAWAKVTIPSEGTNKTYRQCYFSKAGDLPPFFGFFVQVGRTANVTFTPKSKQSAPAHNRQTTENEIYSVGVNLSAGGDKYDETTLVISDLFTSEYEIGFDLTKMLGYADIPQIYTYDASMQYAFQALNPEAAAQELPLGVYLPATGNYTFSLINSEMYDYSQIYAVYLYDKETNITTNLKENNYTIRTNSGLNTETRFAISVALTVPEDPNTPTALPSAEDEKLFSVWQEGANRIMLNGVSAGDQIRVLDLQGRIVAQQTITGTTAVVSITNSGLYVVERTTEASVQVQKILVR